MSYAPYGEPLETGGFGSPFTFTGELLDANALLYLRARYYSPALGVFTGLDPLAGTTKRTMSLNRYRVVRVCARGTSLYQLSTRVTFIAITVNTCCRCVFSKPR
jgi:RHS repeat-associated protein